MLGVGRLAGLLDEEFDHQEIDHIRNRIDPVGQESLAVPENAEAELERGQDGVSGQPEVNGEARFFLTLPPGSGLGRDSGCELMGR